MLYLAQQRWNRFWGSRENNSALTAYLEGERKGVEDVPLNPADAEGDLVELSLAWEAYWTERSPELRDYLDEAARIAVAAPYWNPRPIEEAAIRALLDDACHGRRPQD